MKYPDVCVGDLKTDPFGRTTLVNKKDHIEGMNVSFTKVIHNPLPFVHWNSFLLIVAHSHHFCTYLYKT